jgi:hypothetical protein
VQPLRATQVLISTSTTLLHFLKCHAFAKPDVDGGGEESFLYLDYSLDCYGDRYAQYLPFCLGACPCSTVEHCHRKPKSLSVFVFISESGHGRPAPCFFVSPSFDFSLSAGMILVYPIGIPMIYLTLLVANQRTLSDTVKMDHEADMGFPTVGHITFLTKSYR